MSQATNIFKYSLIVFFLIVFVLISFRLCNQEAQNNFSRSLQNWTGTNGTLEVYAGEKLVKRFLKIDKLTTAKGTHSDSDRPYRFGYGILDENLNATADKGESKVYFEFSDYSTSYIFYEVPRYSKKKKTR